MIAVSRYEQMIKKFFIFFGFCAQTPARLVRFRRAASKILMITQLARHDSRDMRYNFALTPIADLGRVRVEHIRFWSDRSGLFEQMESD